MDKFKFIAKSELSELPKTSGVYSFYEKNKVIYIGKAINIQNRVKNHFNQPSYRDNLFMDKVDKIGYLETNSEIEALILEANLIKKYQPKFNVVWRDDKNYFYVAIAKNDQKIPYIFITHQPKNSKLEIRNSKFSYVGPFVEGTALKKTLRFLRRVFPYYITTLRRGSGQAIHPKTKCTYCHLGLCPGPNPDLKDYKNNIKKLILILKGKRSAVLNSLKREMKDLSAENRFEEAGKIRDRISNLQQVMSHTNVINSEKVGGTSDVPPTLNKILGVDKEIHRIECYDVSNIQGKQATGSMVVFVDGKADKNQYRKFKIKMKNEPNDIAMLKETLQRRFTHPEWKYPEVILIDGGKAQLNVGIKVREQFHRIVPLIISVAKGRQELFIENRKKAIPLKSLPQEVYNLIKNLDDEAHRFAIAYHKKLRKKSLLQ
ncbi:MAG: UvrB/UvrC motif-containing protein [Candidatus Staskawiczbacteria bacterium]|nr:UvrB/UvrC motif-containing protein [Candidatus Staskawiczbacteria bacterium]